MALLLGVDTGGTYTDAVLLDENERVLAGAKALTTRHDLSVGIGEAIHSVLTSTGKPPSAVGLVSLSTTLATNALVEGQGGRICLVLIGFDEVHLTRSSLAAALGDDPVVMLSGGHSAHGEPLTGLQVEALTSKLDSLATSVTSFAIAGLFAVRNPEHETMVRDIIHQHTDLPVTCSHELSSNLDGPRRALTCVLNARIISLLHHLIAATEGYLHSQGIDAPLMVVRGDGALISADVAQVRPIETILSGPAASLVGASHLTGLRDAIVSDIGGTTTDIAVLKDGRPRLDGDGATVGGWRTMVEAVAMRTIGLGGDSEVRLSTEGLSAKLLLGPRRVIPVALLAISNPGLVHDTLDRQLSRRFPSEQDGKFIVPVDGANLARADLTKNERDLYDRCAKGAQALDQVIHSHLQLGTLKRSISRGLVFVSSLTPSDAAHVLGKQKDWDAGASRKAAELFARQRNGCGIEIALEAESLCEWVIKTLRRRSAEIVLDSAFEEDGFREPGLSNHVLAAAALERAGNIVQTALHLELPIIGLGAPARTYYGEVAELLRTQAIVPKYHDVANAVGAVVGRVSVTADAMISAPQENVFRVHLADTPSDFPSLNEAVAFAEEIISAQARERATEAGAIDIRIKIDRDDNVVPIDGRDFFVESKLVATASGRARIAN
jgi:N-methylhydantoinase A/oxoprolinase/acetone carboxylase beta subunit